MKRNPKRVRYDADVDIGVRAEGPGMAGQPAKIRVELTHAEKTVPRSAGANLDDFRDLKASIPDKEFNDQGWIKVKWFANCDPAFGPLDEAKRKQAIHAYPEIKEEDVKQDPSALEGLSAEVKEILALAKSTFDFCEETVVGRHRCFYWWSDHAHFHAVDTGRKMQHWVKYFVRPHRFQQGAIRPAKDPGWRHMYAPLAAWAGHLHDLGMGANPRLELELEALDGLTGYDLERQAEIAVRTFSGRGVVRLPFDDLCEYMRNTPDLEVPFSEDLRAAGLKRIAKEYIANHTDGIRNRHSLNSAVICVGRGSGRYEISEKLEKLFGKSAYVLQKIALTVCMHSKSKYGKDGIAESTLLKGHKDILDSATELKGALDDTAPADRKGPAVPEWGPWLAQRLDFQFTVEAEHPTDGLQTIKSPLVHSSEREHLNVLARCLGVIDNMRDRGNEGRFRDNQGASFFKLPLDEHERDQPDQGKCRRVQCGSFRLRKEGAIGAELMRLKDRKDGPGGATYLDVIRAVNEHHPSLKGLFGDQGKLLAATHFREAVHPGLLNAICTHPDNDVLVPPGNWLFNMGELGIVQTGLFSIDEAAKTGSALKPPIPNDLKPQVKSLTSLFPDLPKMVVDYIKIETDRDPTHVAHIVEDIVKEGPRAFTKRWVIVLDRCERYAETPLREWLFQDRRDGFKSQAWVPQSDWGVEFWKGPDGDVLENPAQDFVQEPHTFAAWTSLWSRYDPLINSMGKSKFKDLRATLFKYMRRFKVELVLRTPEGSAVEWERLDKSELEPS